MGRKIKYFIVLKILQPLVYRLIRMYSWTFRMDVQNEEAVLRVLDSGGVVILACWHQQFFAAIRHFQNYKERKPCIMISPSQDGSIIADVARRTGWQPVRGSSSRRGAAALFEVIKKIRRAKMAAHIVDGPKGPIGVVKPGLIQLTRATKGVVIPFYTVADRAWFFNSWDRFMIPKPFAKVTLRYENPVDIGAPESDEEFEAQRERIQQIMAPHLLLAPDGTAS